MMILKMENDDASMILQWKNDGFGSTAGQVAICISNDEFALKMMNFVFKMMNFVFLIMMITAPMPASTSHGARRARLCTGSSL